MTRKTRTDPNVQDPLSEPSIGRRVWASYLAKGYTRYSFAIMLDVSYTTVDAWDTGRSMPSLEMLMEIARKLDVPLQFLAWGKSGAPEGSAHASGLGREAVIALLNEIGASPAQRAALAQHQDSVDGRFQVFTREYVIAWLAAYDAARRADMSPEDASAAALSAAHTARAVSGAVKAGVRGTASQNEVRSLIQRVQQPAPTPKAGSKAPAKAKRAIKRKR